MKNTTNEDQIMKTNIDLSQCISLKEACEMLSISTATGKNWVKLGKMQPYFTEEKTAYFTKEQIANLKQEIASGDVSALKSRRNKKYVSGNSLYNSYVSDTSKNLTVLQKLLSIVTIYDIELNEDIIRMVLADCALHMLAEKQHLTLLNKRNMLLRYLKKEFSFGEYDQLLMDLLFTLSEDENNAPNTIDAAITFCEKQPLLFNLEYVLEEKEDILGLIYISCKNIGNRKATGVYYTPTKVVKKLTHELKFNADSKILDPCCGTGNFLLQLPASCPLDNVYGNDLDRIGVQITRINMAIKYYGAPLSMIYDHITEKDYLTDYPNSGFDFIIGNPPWGYEFSDDDKAILKKKYKATVGKNVESYDVFIEKGLQDLASGGHLSFVLPEALLNVKAHTEIRKIIMDNHSIRFLEFLGNAFDGVQCPCIILQILHTGKPFSTVGLVVKNEKQKFKIATERKVTADYFSFITTDEEYQILDKVRSLPNIVYLEGNADFALGIVTGNNKEFISPAKDAENEMILKGSDICKYHINPTLNYIVFQPEKFQQVAPTEFYRAPEKLLYRFICNQLVFAYDNEQTLSLNSCNIVIPHLEGLDMKYILAILNSRIAQFIFKKEFNSLKVLRTHIENIPIPVVDRNAQQKLIDITEHLIKGCGPDTAELLYNQLDQYVCELFRLTATEQAALRAAVDGDNKFLVP